MMSFSRSITTIILAILFLTSCSNEDKMPSPPIAESIKHTTQVGGITLEDDYFWLRDPKWPTSVTEPKILDYLKAENQYSASFFDKNKALKEKIFQELKGRIKLSDQSTYIKKDNYYYYSKIEETLNYPIYCRKYGSVDAKEEVILDVNKLAEGKTFTDLDALTISPDHNLLAYSVDFSGDEKNTIRVLDLRTQTYLPDEIMSTGGNIVWHETKPGFFYIPLGDNLRRDKVMFHELGGREDKLIFSETDPLYQLAINRTGSKEYMVVVVAGHDNDECHVLDLNNDNFETKLIAKRRDGIKYSLEHNGEYFYIAINDCGSNFCMKRMRTDLLGAENLMDYIPEDKEKYLNGFDVTKNYLILNYKTNGLISVIVRDIAHGDKTIDEHVISFPDVAFTANGGSTSFESDDIRVNYSSLGRPNTIYSYDFNSDKLSVLKEQNIPSGFDPDEYKVERIFADNNGTLVPISLVYKKSLFKKDGSNPLYLYGYGSYGIAIPPSFNSVAISLVNRGFIYAIAHIRGGDDLGYAWYESAKFLNKKRTFEDFIAASEHMIKEKYTSAGNIVIYGGSAGGMLVGDVINERPELYRAVLLQSPFLDVLNTMLDDTLPLTKGEFKEWGNPKDPEYFNYISSYSPYDNIKAQNYPNIFVTSGISDPRVGYFEPAKWVAKLRKMKTDNNMLLLKTNMDAGHQGSSGRFEGLKDAADDYVFIFRMWGIE